MSDATVRTLGGDDWQTYQRIRLQALQDAPEAFVSSYALEKDFDEAFWRERMGRSVRLLASANEEPVGIVSVRAAADEVAELFGLWVAPNYRGKGVAWELTEAAAEHARAVGRRALQLWVAVDNGRAVAFFSSAGFRPSDQRRPMHYDAQSVEAAMVLPVGDDPGSPLAAGH